ncbi:sensor histidine kinase [Methylocystis echinoides]|uniref:histidine kinase n=1 Tax=Methylocystis echinoides TaxID=29468 RepID=A0A9W6GYQ8_9HYPH|nr:PAS domain S-box protein [Methylocystis echinoides]GLI95448.1 hypothetical protein LMG27198_44400 [Methylocystis echinoides]
MIAHKDGSHHHCEIEDEAAEPNNAAGAPQAEALQQLNALKWFYDNAHVGFCVIDLDLRFHHINSFLAEINGVPVEAHLGRTVAEVVPALLPLVQQVTTKILATRRPVTNYEFSGETAARPGVTRHWLESWHPLIGDDGAIVGFAVTVEEITQRKEAEEALKKLVERYELVSKGAGDAIWDWDVPNHRVYFSPRWKELHGHGDELIGGSEELWKSSIHPEDLSRVMDAVAAHFEGKTDVFLEEYRIRCRDGSEKWVLDRGLARRDQAGVVTRMAGSEHDITSRKRAEEALAQSHEDFRRAQEVGQIGWWRFRLPQNVLDWSEENYRIFSVPFGEPVTYDLFLSLVHPDDRDYVQDRWSAALAGEPYDIEHRVVLDGAVKWLREKAYLEFDEAGALLGGFGITQDITARKRVEESLLEMHRHKDEFITMLAHELRNPLAPLRSGLYVLRKSEAIPRAHGRIQEIMERQVDHLIRLVDDLLDVSRISRGRIALKKERLSLGDLVMQVVESRSALSSTEECHIRVNFRESPLFIAADPVRLTQILANLLDNATKYSPAKGDIDITLDRQGEHAVISVKDNGYGIPADMLPRIFDVFVQVDQNQSQARGGLGIGLALVRSLVELHGGTVEAHSGGKDKGSEFVVRLPLSSSQLD